MLSQDKCLPIAYKCLGFTVLFVLGKYSGFYMVFICNQETITTADTFPKVPINLKPRVLHTPHLYSDWVGQREGGCGPGHL